MITFDERLTLAKKELGRSVISINPNFWKERRKKRGNPLLFGIKDTNQIPNELITKLVKHPEFLWLTIDKAANRGRAIDTDLINPITYRLMTGSTSGGPVNIVKGLIDFAIGTDGGGSILAPAMSCQLPSMIGAGLGLVSKSSKLSTDGIKFRPSVGVIGKNFSIVRKVMEVLIDNTLDGSGEHRKVRIIIPKKGSVVCPDNEDMNEKLMRYFLRINLEEFTIDEVEMTGIDDRRRGIQIIQDQLHSQNADLIVTCEGPVDVFGYGETLPMHFGKTGKKISQDHGKYLLRSANMCKTTAISIPTENLATSILIIGRNGLEHARLAVHLASAFEQVIHLPKVWKDYYLGEIRM